MKYYLNGKERPIISLKTKAPRKIQEEAIVRIQETIKNNGKLLVNMPCRSGKTFTDLYSAYHAGIELVIVLCGKVSAKSSYETDSVWINKATGKIEGFNRVRVNNSSVKELLADTSIIEKGDRVLIEITPQLLNRHPELTVELGKLAKTMKTLFTFDEAHFAEQTDKTKAIIKTVAEDEIDADKLAEGFTNIPWVYLTASPDTQSLRNVFSVENDNYYELTKEREWELYLEDLKKPVEEREFDYIPVINGLFIMNKLFDSVYNSAKATRQDYTSLFTQNTARRAAKKFVELSLTKAIEIMNTGFGKEFMAEYIESTYTRRGTNLNLMIKVPVNNSKTNKSGKTVAENVTELIKAVEANILATFPEFTSIEIKDATLINNISQEQANQFFESNKTSINIILTQQRLIEGTTLKTLDGFLYYCNSGSLVKYKQESGRTLTPADLKKFGFIFFFDEDALANVKAVLQAKINKIKGAKKHGPRKLTESDAKKLTRINPAFIVGDTSMKLVDYSQSLYTKSELESTRTKNNLIDKELLFAIPGLRELIADLLCKMSGNTTKKKADKPSGTGAGSYKKPGSKKVVKDDTPIEEIELEKFVGTLIYSYQDCIQNNIPVETISDKLKTVFDMNSLNPKALEKLYENEYTYGILMEIHEVLANDQSELNEKATGVC